MLSKGLLFNNSSKFHRFKCTSTNCRELKNFEKNFINSNERIQFAVEVDDPFCVPLIIENLKKSIFGFQLNITKQNDQLFLIENENQIKVHDLPKTIRTCQEASDYIDNYIPINYSDTLASIAANDTKVVVSVSHMIYDGGFFVRLYDHLLDRNLEICKNRIPATTHELFEKELSRDDFDMERRFNSMKRMTRLKYSPSNKLEANLPDYAKCNYYAIETPADEMQFMKHRVGLNNYYWTMIPLVLTSLNGNFQCQNIGISNCVDLRQIMPPTTFSDNNKSNLFSITNNFSELNIFADQIRPENTIRDVAKAMREKFNIQMAGTDLFTSFKSMDEGFPEIEQSNVIAEFSNIGRFQLKRPFTDCWIQQTMLTKSIECFAAFLAFSRNKKGQNVCVTRFQQARGVISDDDAKILLNSLVYAMKEIPPDVSYREAFDEVKRFQNNFRKNDL